MAGLLRMGSIRSTKKREMEFDIFNPPFLTNGSLRCETKPKYYGM